MPLLDRPTPYVFFSTSLSFLLLQGFNWGPPRGPLGAPLAASSTLSETHAQAQYKP